MTVRRKGTSPAMARRPARAGARAHKAGAGATQKAAVDAGSVEQTGAATGVAARLKKADGTASAAKAALAALAMDVRVEEKAAGETGGAQAATLGAKLQGFMRSEGFRKGAMVAMGGLSLLGTAQNAMADTVFLDHNNAPKEIDAARQLANEAGEDLIVARPRADVLEKLFERAASGEIEIRHLILSGHSAGSSVWGEGADGTSYESSIDEYRALREKYPEVFDKVELVHFMACYAGSEGNSAQWQELFPNARAIVGFYGSGPASSRPASAWTLTNTTRALRDLPSEALSPQAALLKAKQLSRLDGPRHTTFGVRVDGVSAT